MASGLNYDIGVLQSNAPQYWIMILVHFDGAGIELWYVLLSANSSLRVILNVNHGPTRQTRRLGLRAQPVSHVALVRPATFRLRSCSTFSSPSSSSSAHPVEHTRFLQTNKAPFNLCLSVHLIVYVHAPACKSFPCSSAIRGWNKPLLVLRAVRRWCVWFACGFCNSYVPKDGGAQAVESGANSVPVSVHTFALFMSSELIPTLVI